MTSNRMASPFANSLSENVLNDKETHHAEIYNHVMSMVEKELIKQVLQHCRGIQTKTAAQLGINRNTLHKKIEEYELEM